MILGSLIIPGDIFTSLGHFKVSLLVRCFETVDSAGERDCRIGDKLILRPSSCLAFCRDEAIEMFELRYWFVY